MARQIWLIRDEAELLVDMLEDNYKTAKYYNAGMGADLAAEIREFFGMIEQPPMEYMQDVEEQWWY